MKSILCSLYNGDITPCERRNPNNEKYREIQQKIEDEERYFMAKMSLDDCQRFQALSDLYTKLSLVEEESLFSYAFMLGMLLMMDAIKEAEEVLNG
jgi:hypothetical protein